MTVRWPNYANFDFQNARDSAEQHTQKNKRTKEFNVCLFFLNNICTPQIQYVMINLQKQMKDKLLQVQNCLQIR